MIRSRWRSIVRALRELPRLSDWRRLSFLYLLYLVVALSIGFATGFLVPSRAPLSTLFRLALPLLLLIKPAFLEEVVFRGALLPHPREGWTRGATWSVLVVSLVAFVGMHPLAAMLYRHSVLDLFTDPRFLALALTLGAACSGAYLLTGSLWPAILLHWVSVTAWIEFLGGAARLKLVG